MVFRFTPSQDLEMMRELIRLKQFAAKRGTAQEVWDNVATSFSEAIQHAVKVKQIRDRLNLLKARARENEQRSFLASGVEESLDTVNVQSHYSDIDGKVHEYMELERVHHEKKANKKLAKARKEEDLTQCAADIVVESRRRRADRVIDSSESDTNVQSDDDSVSSAAESSISTGSARSGTSTFPAPKRSNAFLSEVKRQEKRYKEQMELKVRELEQNQKQFEERLALEKKQSEDRLNFEDRIQTSNRDMILGCAKIFGATLSKK